MFFLYIFRYPSLFNSLSCFSVPKTKKKLYYLSSLEKFLCRVVKENVCSANEVSLPILWKSIFQMYLPILPGALLAKLWFVSWRFSLHCFQRIRNIWCLPAGYWISVLRFYSAAPWQYLNISFTFLANHFLKNIILAVYFT